MHGKGLKNHLFLQVNYAAVSLRLVIYWYKGDRFYMYTNITEQTGRWREETHCDVLTLRAVYVLILLRYITFTLRHSYVK
jgi:hypothetical protein